MRRPIASGLSCCRVFLVLSDSIATAPLLSHRNSIIVWIAFFRVYLGAEVLADQGRQLRNCNYGVYLYYGGLYFIWTNSQFRGDLYQDRGAGVLRRASDVVLHCFSDAPQTCLRRASDVPQTRLTPASDVPHACLRRALGAATDGQRTRHP